MQNIQDKFKIDIDKLKGEQLSVIKAIKKEGEAHMKYYHRTMEVFKNPESRVKCYDTKYYEEVLPEVNRILNEYSKRQIIINE